MNKALRYAKDHKKDLLALLLLTLLAPFFFYKLGQSSLVSWDEAWYAAIAREILQRKDFLVMHFNGQIFNDHPPFGFWMMALSFKIFGINNFAARAASAVFGILSLYATYFLGKELFSRMVGFVSALALSSATWFLYRSRSGDLDIFLTFFFVSSIYLAIKASKDKRFLLPFFVSLLFLFLTKTVVPFTIIPALFIVFWKRWPKLKDIKIPVFVFVAGIAIWLFAQLRVYPTFLRRYFGIGLPSYSLENNYLSNLKQVWTYLHQGIGKWFWPGVFSVIAGLLTRKRNFLILFVFCASFFLPFMFSFRGQIWHLIPLYPFLILSFFGLAYYLADFVTKSKWMPGVFILTISLYFSFILLRQEWYQFVNISAFVTDEEILSKEAAKYPDDYIIDGDFIPTAVFYSDKTVKQTYVGGIKELFDTRDHFILFTKKERLDAEGIKKGEYKILKSDRDKILVRKL